MARSVFLFLSAFLASGVEVVEALTIVLAVGVTRGWESTLLGVGAAALALAALTAGLGSAISSVPIGDLRLVVGGLLLVFGLQWLRKAILRATGYQALHDEATAYDKEREAASEAAPTAGRVDWYSFALSFKSVFLEGLEVVFIVISFGAAKRHGIALAAAAAVAAVVVVVGIGAVVRGPLSRVPENRIKFVVGLLLTSFGTFWSAEGAGISWPGSDAALLVILGLYVATSFVAVRVLGRGRPSARVASKPQPGQSPA